MEMAAMTDEAFFSKHKTITIHDAEMSYYESGPSSSERTIVFLHGNPTSSYLWRNVIPRVADLGRCLAPDLVGMGRSSKIPGSMYTFQDHYKYLEKWMDSVNLPNKLNLVIHDWGSGLGFHWANLHRDRVQSISFMEGFVAPNDWSDFGEQAQMFLKKIKSPEGEDLILRDNMFVEVFLPLGIERELSEDEMGVYLAPFKEEGEGRRPTLTFPREIPIVSEGPENVVKLLTEYNKWLSQSIDLPKLYIHATPGFLAKKMDKEVKDWPNVQRVECQGKHFVQEDCPDLIGKAVRDFLVAKVFQ